ncbi:MAG: hypothetical protein Q9191_004048 [Dirinaria sp. TL-2023a]
MSDPSEPKPPSIPTWQRQQQPPSPSADDEAQPQTPDTPTDSPSESSPRSDLLQKASKFLQDDEIRAASTERKTSFLESKGLTSDEIQRLLDAPPATSDTEPVAEQEQGEQQNSHQAPPTNSQHPETKDLSRESPNQDIPPIITYPENLFRPPASPPIVTLSRLLNTAYVLSSAVAVTYVLQQTPIPSTQSSKKPSQQSLTTPKMETEILLEKTTKGTKKSKTEMKPKPLHFSTGRSARKQARISRAPIPPHQS